MESTSTANNSSQAYPIEEIYSCQTHVKQSRSTLQPSVHQENVQPVYHTQMLPHINEQQTGPTIVLVVSLFMHTTF